MSSYVMIDAGVAFKLLAPNPARDAIKHLVRQWSSQQLTLCAPSLWLYEVTSILSKMVQLAELEAEDARDILDLAKGLGVELIEPEQELARTAFAWTRRLERAASYDSFYLALAERLGCELWTVDRRLVNSVNQPWVRLAGAG
jgi:predicted nucleic acid-binding protein